MIGIELESSGSGRLLGMTSRDVIGMALQLLGMASRDPSG